MMKLIQFPISHYCEKVRWTLNYKKLDFEIVNLLPGPHFIQTRKYSKRSSVPILIHDGKPIQGSGNIITYLDETFPDRSLTPTDPKEKAEALEWETFADAEVGVHVRRCLYEHLLDTPDIVIPMFATDGPWYATALMKATFPVLRKKMKLMMNINPEKAKYSRERLNTSVDRLQARYKTNEYLVGDSFTRADLTAAALMAPFYMPEGYGLNWPKDLPEPSQELLAEFSNRIGWVGKSYSKYR